MNYYEHHIGDYAEATAHLTFLEDAAYSRCLRKYYATERPLPADIKAVQRLVGARTKEEREAVESVLKEFFELLEDGWHQRRCDEEIARYAAGEPDRQIKRANEESRLKKHREERARLFQALHAVGESPPWNIPMAQLRELHARFCSGTETRTATPPETLQQPLPATAPATPATATHTPDTSLHSQSPGTSPQDSESESLPSGAVQPSGIEPRFAASGNGDSWDDDPASHATGANPKPEGAMAVALRNARVVVRSTDAILHQWLKDGITTERLLEAVSVARIRKPNEAIPAAYLDKIVRDNPAPADSKGQQGRKLTRYEQMQEALKNA